MPAAHMSFGFLRPYSYFWRASGYKKLHTPDSADRRQICKWAAVIYLVCPKWHILRSRSSSKLSVFKSHNILHLQILHEALWFLLLQGNRFFSFRKACIYTFWLVCCILRHMLPFKRDEPKLFTMFGCSTLL